MAVDDNYREAIRKSAEEVTPSDPTEYFIKVKEVAPSPGAFSILDVVQLFKDEIDALTYDNVQFTTEGTSEILQFRQGTIPIKELVVDDVGADYNAFLRDAVLLLITESGDNVTTEDGDNIQLA